MVLHSPADSQQQGRRLGLTFGICAWLTNNRTAENTALSLTETFCDIGRDREVNVHLFKAAPKAENPRFHEGFRLGNWLRMLDSNQRPAD
jgi:hypothetical protein